MFNLKIISTMVDSQTIDYVARNIASRMMERFKLDYATKPNKSLMKFGRGDKRIDYIHHIYLVQLASYALCDHPDRLVLVGDNDLRVFNGRFYERIQVKPDAFIREVVQEAFNLLEIGSIYIVHTPKEVSSKVKNSLMTNSKFRFEPTPDCVGFRNGIFDLNKRKLVEFSVNLRPAIVFDFDFNSQASDVLWPTKLQEILPNADCRDAFQQFIGSLLLDRSRYKIEYICYIVGDGANGKSVLADSISNLFGAQYISHFTPKQLFKNSDAQVNVAALSGKVLNVIGDLDNSTFSGGEFKNFVSGGKIQARRLFGDPIEVTPPPLLACANAIPDTDDDSEGHHRRQLKISTTTRKWGPSERDTNLTAKLAEDAVRQVMILWVFEGYYKVMSQGGEVRPADGILLLQEEQKRLSNNIRRWIAEDGLDAPDKVREWRTDQAWFNAYKSYLVRSGDGVAKPRPRVKEALVSIGGIAQRRNCTEGQGWGIWVGNVPNPKEIYKS